MDLFVFCVLCFTVDFGIWGAVVVCSLSICCFGFDSAGLWVCLYLVSCGCCFLCLRVCWF